MHTLGNHRSVLCRETRIWCTKKNRGAGLWRNSDPLPQVPPPYQPASSTTGAEPCPGGSRTRSHSRAPAVASELCPVLGSKYQLSAERKKDECVIYLKIMKKKRKKEFKEPELSDSEFSDKESFDSDPFWKN